MISRFRLLGLVTAAVLLASSFDPALPQCRQWDRRFSLPGTNFLVRAQCVFDDGRGPALYVGGEFHAAGSSVANFVARWDGKEWAPLGSGLQSYGGHTCITLAALDDGTGPALYAGGAFTGAGGTPALNIAKWNGSAWASLGAGIGDSYNHPEDQVNALVAFDDGSGRAIYAGGEFTSAGGAPAMRIARWNGSTWSPVGSGFPGPFNEVHALAVFDDGTGPALYAGGYFYDGVSGVSGVMKWNGTSWIPLYWTNPGTVQTLAVFDTGQGPRLVAGGYTRVPLAEWDGTHWSRFGAGLPQDTDVTSLAVQDFGGAPELFASVCIHIAFEQDDNRLARWNGSSWQLLPGSASDDIDSIVGFDDGSGPAVYLGGFFREVAGVRALRIARWNRGHWSAVGAAPACEGLDVPGSAWAMAVFDEGAGPKLFAAGDFRTAGTARAESVARWDGHAWSPVGGGINGGAFATTVFDDGSGPALYVGGLFTSAGGIPAANIARWNGSNWSPVGSGFPGSTLGISALIVHDDGTGPALFAGGYFSTAGGIAARSIAKWNGRSWSPLGAGIDGRVFALAVHDDGSGPVLYAGGQFWTAGGTPAINVARWDGSNWSPLGTGTDGTVRSLFSYDDGTTRSLYTGGMFWHAGGTLARGVARWDGAQWTAAGDGCAFEPWAFAAFDDGAGRALYAGGSSSLHPLVSGLTRWNGSTWTSVSDAPNGIDSLAVFRDPRTGHEDLFAGGAFVAAGDVVSVGIARWTQCTTATEFCAGGAAALPCPCGNVGLARHGCENSAGTGGAQLAETGSTAPDDVVFQITGAIPVALSIFFQGDDSISPRVFGDGVRCVGGNLLRLYVTTTSGGSASVPSPGDPSISSRSAALGDVLLPGSTRSYQVLYRDADPTFCPAPLGGTWNLSNAIALPW